MKILIIAPHGVPSGPELNTPLEIEELGLGHQVVTLTGVVTHDRITRATATNRFEAIHVAAHCTNNEVQLSEGQVLTRDQLSQIGRKVRADLIFLNACDSANFAQYLVDTGLPVVIAWTIAVLDENGVRTACYFYDELLHNKEDLHAAYRKINPQDGSFLFLAGLSYVESILLPIVQRLDQVGQQLTSLVQVISRQRFALILLAALILAGLLLAAALIFIPWPATQAKPTANLVLTPTVEPPTATPLPVATDTVAPAIDTPVIDTPAPTETAAPATVVEPVETDTPVIVPPSDTLTPLPTNTSKPRRTATDTPTRAPTWTKTPEPPLAITPVLTTTLTITTSTPLAMAEPINTPTFNPNLFTPWPPPAPRGNPPLGPKTTPTPLGEPPNSPALAPCFTPVQKE